MSAAGSANGRVDQVVTFDPDPNGWGMFRSLVGRALRDLGNSSARPVLDARGSDYGGWAASPQRFTGLAWLAAGSARPIASPASYLVNQRSADVPGIAAAYDRLRRQS